MAVKFPLKMADGTMVRTLEDLREHFDLTTVLSYYDNGRLVKWLENGYYDEEAGKVAALDVASADFAKELCAILGVGLSQNRVKQIDLDVVAQKNQRLEALKRITADDAILEAENHVAFTQTELANLIDARVSEIYLCGEQFIIPGDIGGITYIGVNNPAIQISGNTVAEGIDLKDLYLDIGGYVGDYIDGQSEAKQFFTVFENNLALGMKLLHACAEKGSAKMQIFLGACYEYGRNVEKNDVKAGQWYQKAADQEYAAAQNIMGNIYNNGFAVQQDFAEAVKWYRKAAEQGHPDAQNSLGFKYKTGEGVEQNYEEANKWFLCAAKQGNSFAQYNLGISYRDGTGIEQSEENAIEWFQKAVAQGNEGAKAALLKLDPKRFKLSEVIIHTVGGTGNLLTGTAMNRDTGTIDVVVEDRNKVDVDLLRRFGVVNVWTEVKYFFGEKIKPSMDISFRDVGNRLKGLFKTALLDEPPDISFKEPETETVCEDLGGGWVHIQMQNITYDMEEDFSNHVIPYCHDSMNESFRKIELDIQMTQDRTRLFLGDY